MNWIKLTKWAVVATVAAALSTTASIAQATFPEGPIKIIVSNPAGSNSDLIVRMLAPKMSEVLGQPVVVENHPGGNEMLGAQLVAGAPADGYMMLFGTSTIFAANPVLFDHVSYDAVRDFAGVGLIGTNPNVILVSASSPVNTINELVDLVKSQPGALNYGTSPGGSLISSSFFVNTFDLDIQEIPYKSGPEALTDLAGGAMTFFSSAIAAASPLVQAGQLKPLATTGTERPVALADVPTMVEAGYPDFVVGSSVGLVVPRATPRPVVEILHAALAEALTDPEVKKRFETAGTLVGHTTPEEYDALIAKEIPLYHDLLVTAGAK